MIFPPFLMGLLFGVWASALTGALFFFISSVMLRATSLFTKVQKLMIPIEPTAEHPVPFDVSDVEPKTHKDAVAVAVNTIDVLQELGGSIDFNNDDLHKASNLIKGAEKPNKPRHVSSSAEAAAAHALIKEFDFQAFADVMQARNFITNKLISLSNSGDPKIEIKALELLGKHSDIGLFTERSEITINHTTSESLEKSIKERVKRLLNADVTDVAANLVDELDEISPKASQTAPENVDEDPENEHEEGQTGE